MFDENDLAEFADLVDMVAQEFTLEGDRTTFTAAMEEDKAEIGNVFGGNFAENYSVSGRTAMLQLKPGVQLTANDIIIATRTQKRWQVHDVTEAAFPVTVMRYALLSVAPM